MNNFGKLYIVSTPIGNYEDITLRALRILKEVDFIICEEYKEAKRILSYYKIDKPLFSVNEHNEKENSDEVVEKIKRGLSAALISDGGTPLFSDPGNFLFSLCVNSKIEIIVVPGVNSLITALTGAGLTYDNFYFAGWISPKKEIRRKTFINLKKKKELLIIMETPYRLRAILADVASIFGKKTFCVIAFQLTQKDENYFRGSVDTLLNKVEESHLKGEFVLIIDNRNSY